jgi:uncharacterized Zn finger protein
MSYYGWAPYVSVAERRAKAQKQLEKMKKKGFNVQPVQLCGKKIADSFWGKGWCDHMESFSDYANRLLRGRSYVRNGSVCHLDIKSGRIEAIVSGSALYNVAITILPMAIHKWKSVKSVCTGRIGSLIDLLRGRLDRGVMEVVSDRKEGLFPLPGEMKFTCDCPDWAGMCKHVAAVLYGVGARLDHSPEMLFLLRGVDHEELVDVSAVVTGAAKAGTSRRRIADSGLADVFGVDMAETGGNNVQKVTPAKISKTTIKLPEKTSAVLPKQNKITTAKAKGKNIKPIETPFPDPLTGDVILAWRTSLGETQANFAIRINVFSATVPKWEKKGKNKLVIQSRSLAKLRKAWEQTHK